MTIHARLKWTGGLQFIGRAGSGPAVVLDNREGASGPSPMEMVLMGAAGCTAMDVVSILRKKRANVTGFTINVSGERAEKHPKRYTAIHIEYVFEGNDLNPKSVEQAIDLSVEKYCSATASLKADIQHTYRIVKGEG